MKVFIVHAHPEPKSFNAALTRVAVETFEGGGHDVVVSDLYTMGWEPVSGPQNFTGRKDPAVFKQQVEEAHAVETNGFSVEVQAEMDKLFACDALIFQFPMWWFSMPAILKGWVDRVFAFQRVYGGGRWYDHGTMRGKRAMASVTTGGPATMYEETGLAGDMNMLLAPVNQGVFRYVGFDVLPSFVAWAPARSTEADRAHMLAAYRERLLAWDTTAPLMYPSLSAYDPSFRLARP
ncbi:NAD(P)H-dependent oxidoreductase [Polyangium mundeleinium]|uniref:NAD(P)H-dependent oxidoreductase n=1 Tax=Polyangium mundeleinium TaxID=2995306 RepID=A0ABT5EQJ5_9BACT|nr:NAD(P)H-dependent oxidoreductase [Polyangium mundeleinium]MDC0744113.1 NAD(P)H-dependent oxidoreductase [Polyangium mundeleinium]